MAANAVAMEAVYADVETVDADIIDAETANVVAALSEKKPTDKRCENQRRPTAAAARYLLL